MATTKIQDGCVLTVTAPEDLVAGEVTAIGSLVGVALMSAVSGADVDIDTEGVWEVAKTSALAIDVGDKLYLDAANDVVNKTNTGQFVGVAVTSAANPSSTVRVLLGKGGV